MSRFTGPLDVSFSDSRYAFLREDLVWEVGHEGSGVEIRVPAGFISDGATVPRILWPIMPPWGDKGTRAAILHDYLLSILKPNDPEYAAKRTDADRQFQLALLALGVNPVRALICWAGVHIFTRLVLLGIYPRVKTV